jgi:hypothetical protein
MEFGLIAKVLFFALWPLIFVYLYYLTNKKKFMAKWERFKKDGWLK